MNTVHNELPMKELYPLIQESFAAGLSVTLGVSGNSMAPLWRHQRDSVVLCAWDHTPLKRGNVPLYIRKNGKFTLHRVVRVTESGYVMAGDAQTTLEKGIQDDQIVAIVTAFIRKGKYIRCTDTRYRIYVFLRLLSRPMRHFGQRLCSLPTALKRRLQRAK